MKKSIGTLLLPCLVALATVFSASAARAAYWNLFNIEGESAISAEFVTYATLADMLNDENRLGAFVPDGAFIGRNIVGSGADILSRPPGAVPEPSVISMLAGALAMLALRRRRWPRSLA